MTILAYVESRSFAYNGENNQKELRDSQNTIIGQYRYDANGNLTSKTDARGVVTSYVYDALNRVTQRSYSTPNGTPGLGVLANYQATPNVSYFYDDVNVPFSKGRLTKVTSSISETRYNAFDNLGRVLSSSQVTDGQTYNFTYTYNLSGALIEQTYPSGRVVKNVLESDGDLSMVQSKKTANSGFFNYAKHFTYAASGAVTSMRLGNGLWESTQFNSRLQPTRIALGTTQVATNLLKLDYEYGATAAVNNGNVTKQTITVPTLGQHNGFTAVQTYNYDSLNRLKSATENIDGNPTPSWKQTFTFDRYGNRRFDAPNTTTLAPGCAEAVCNPQIDPATNKLIGYQFDDAGNTKTDANGQTFVYDSENKQVQVNNASGTVGQYFYNGDGQRVKKVVPSTGETTIFVYDAASKLVAEYSTIVAASQDAKVAYLTNDHLGSPRINTDALGQVVSRRDFRPFGEEVARANYGSDSVRQKFTGYERDIEFDLDYANARYYNPMHGRFTSPDPLIASGRAGNPQTWNRYNYAGNNPLVNVDPTGMDWIRSNERDKDGQYIYHDVYGKELKKYLKSGDYSRVDFGGADSSTIYRNDVPIYEMFAKGGGREIATPSTPSPDPAAALVNAVGEAAPQKIATVGLVAATGVAVGTGAGVVMAATGTAAGTGVTVLGLTEAGTGTLAATTTAPATTTAATTSIQTSSTIGRALTGFTKHGINSAISHNGVGVSTRAILNTLRDPIKVVAQSEGRLKVVGKDAVVVLNRAGEVITTWARNSGATRVRP